jgi:hypothetical protein
MGPEQQIEFEETVGPEIDKLVEEDNRRLREELLPLYREMLDCFTRNMWLAEPDTRKHFATLVEYLDIWDRALTGTMPRGVVRQLDHREERWYPLYDSLESHFEGLRREMKS